MTSTTSLNQYRLLGRSGLRVSPLSLGTMTFGSDWGWGADDAEARRIFDAYVDRGGNFIDTSVNYTNGASEKILGRFAKGKREQLILATKYTMARDPANINSGGNHRFNLVRSVETSLRQLDTDRIDLLYVHAWDFTTRPDEVMRSLDDLVRAGKVLYLGICNTPAWRVAELQTLADLRGWSPLVALQIEYSLVERTVEHELLPMAQAMGLGVLPWSPLGGGILTGKYSRADLSDDNGADVASDRKGVIASTGHLNQRSLDIADVVGSVAESWACRAPRSRSPGRWPMPRWSRRSSARARWRRPRTTSARWRSCWATSTWPASTRPVHPHRSSRSASSVDRWRSSSSSAPRR